MNPIASTVVKYYQDSFSSEPKLFFSPGRINLIGEHVDYNEGLVMPASIDKGVYFAVAENGTDDIHFYSIDYHEWYSVNLSDIRKVSGWMNYLLSVVNEFLIAGKIIKGFNCVFGGDIPRGSGMSSSAAVEGGIAYALNQIFNIGLSKIELAKLCQRAEHNFPNVKCGIMDQFTNMMGKKDNVLLLDCKTLDHTFIPLHMNGFSIVLLNTGVHHSLASGQYNIRRQRCEEGLGVLREKLNVHSFRDIGRVEDLSVYENYMTPEVFNCCKYVIEEMARTKKASVFLQENNIPAVGKLLFETHEGLKNLYKVSSDELDFLVQQAKQNTSVEGARLMGGGFGGCTINIVKQEQVQHFIEETTVLFKNKFSVNLEAYLINTSDGTHELVNSG